jgi:hypothetical protein
VLLMTDAIKVAIEHTSSDPVEVFLPYVNRKFRGASTASFSRSQALPACFALAGDSSVGWASVAPMSRPGSL